MKKDVVQKYLDHMSDTIQKRIGPLAGRIRSFLTDSMELEGSNWTDSMADRFRSVGYDLMPYLPLMQWKTHRLGDVWDTATGHRNRTSSCRRR
ncbi:MAG: glycosyl hydrolase [Alistipes indistinctus]